MRIGDRLAKLEARAKLGNDAAAEQQHDARVFMDRMTALADRLPPEEAADTLAFRDALLRTGDAFLINAFGFAEYGDWHLCQTFKKNACYS